MLTGCQKMTEKEKMLSYMENRYEKEFIYLEDYAGQFGKAYEMIVVAPADCPEKKVLIRARKEEEETIYEDNYLAYLIKAEVEDIISPLADACFGESLVEYQIPQFVFPAAYGTDMTAEEFLSKEMSLPRFHIYPQNAMEQDSLKECTEKFCALLQEEGYCGCGTVYQEELRLVFSMDEKEGLRYLRLLSSEGSDS